MKTITRKSARDIMERYETGSKPRINRFEWYQQGNRQVVKYRDHNHEYKTVQIEGVVSDYDEWRREFDRS